MLERAHKHQYRKLTRMMPSLLTATESEAPEQALSRRLRDLRQIAAAFRQSRTKPLQACQAILGGRTLDLQTRSFFAGLPADEKHYWIASLYALFMPAARRRRLAAYFTPPHLAHYAIETLVDAGIEPGRDRILDPASGGAAFLVPLAACISRKLRQRGASAETILRTIESSISGVEIEPDLAKLSKALLCDLLRPEIIAASRKPDIFIQNADTLKLPSPENRTKHVPSDTARPRYAAACTPFTVGNICIAGTDTARSRSRCDRSEDSVRQGWF